MKHAKKGFTAQINIYALGFEATVLASFAKITENMDQQSQILSQIARQNKNLNVIARPDSVPNFPIGNMQDFNSFEATLKEGGPNAELMKSYLVLVILKHLHFINLLIIYL